LRTPRRDGARGVVQRHTRGGLGPFGRHGCHAGRAPVTADVGSLVAVGFPHVNGRAGAIPSLNALQLAAINDVSILEGNHLVVSAPTSSGKTMVGELTALRAILDRKRAIFLLPLKALVADKKRHFDTVFRDVTDGARDAAHEHVLMFADTALIRTNRIMACRISVG
jgi:hypothetical protein